MIGLSTMFNNIIKEILAKDHSYDILGARMLWKPKEHSYDILHFAH